MFIRPCVSPYFSLLIECISVFRLSVCLFLNRYRSSSVVISAHIISLSLSLRSTCLPICLYVAFSLTLPRSASLCVRPLYVFVPYKCASLRICLYIPPSRQTHTHWDDRMGPCMVTFDLVCLCTLWPQLSTVVTYFVVVAYKYWQV